MFEDECMNELGTIMVYVSYNQWPNDPSDKNVFGRLENKKKSLSLQVSAPPLTVSRCQNETISDIIAGGPEA